MQDNLIRRKKIKKSNLPIKMNICIRIIFKNKAPIIIFHKYSVKIRIFKKFI